MAIQAFEKRAWESLVGRVIDAPAYYKFGNRRLLVAGFDADLGFTLVDADNTDDYCHCFRMPTAQLAKTKNSTWWKDMWMSESNMMQDVERAMRVMAHHIRKGEYNEQTHSQFTAARSRNIRHASNGSQTPSASSCAFAM